MGYVVGQDIICDMDAHSWASWPENHVEHVNIKIESLKINKGGNVGDVRATRTERHASSYPEDKDYNVVCHHTSF